MAKPKNKILITGGNGFIGKRLTARLLQSGYQVYVLDNVSVKTDKTKNLFFIKADITDSKLAGKLPKNIDIIIHLAAKFSPNDYSAKPLKTYQINVNGTQNMLEYARQAKAKHFIYPSSCYVYGDAVKPPFSEDSRIMPNSALGAGKAASEHLCYMYYRCFDLSATILRIFTVYGPGASKKHFIGFLINEFLGKKQINLGSQSHTRDFVYIDDVINAFVKAVNIKNPGFEIFNIGSGKETSIRQAVRAVQGLVDQGAQKIVKFNTKKARPDEKDRKTRMQADIAKAKRKLNWQAKTILKTGLAKTIKYFNDQNKN